MQKKLSLVIIVRASFFQKNSPENPHASNKIKGLLCTAVALKLNRKYLSKCKENHDHSSPTTASLF